MVNYLMDHLKRINNLLTFAAMKFWQRLLRYLIGFGLGCLLVFWMFPNHDWLGWLPNRQIRQIIKSSKITLSNSAKCAMNEQSIAEKDWIMLLEEGSINYEKSETVSSPKIYFFEDDLLEMKCQTIDSTSKITWICRKKVTLSPECINQ
jgi:hypothetical protein